MARRTLDPNRPTIADIRPHVLSIYARHSAGCCLHVLLDDGNVGDSTAAFCAEEAHREGHPDCIAAADMLVKMSKTQREKAGTLA